MGAMAKGVIPFKDGYAVRVTEGDKLTAKATLDEETSDLVGQRVMTAPIEEGEVYVVRNVDKSVSRSQLVRTLAKGMGWQTRSEGMNTRGKVYNELRIFSLEPPPTMTLALKDSSARTMSKIYIATEASATTERNGGFGLIKGLQNAQIQDGDSEEDGWNEDAAAMDRIK